MLRPERKYSEEDEPARLDTTKPITSDMIKNETMIIQSRDDKLISFLGY